MKSLLGDMTVHDHRYGDDHVSAVHAQEQLTE
jgi:hypothetical protein